MKKSQFRKRKEREGRGERGGIDQERKFPPSFMYPETLLFPAKGESGHFFLA